MDFTTTEYHVLEDNASHKDKWQVKKSKTHLVADSYSRLGYNSKASRVNFCGTYLQFKRYTDSSLKLHSANFCKVRLCPLCSWRRSLKIFGQTSRILDNLKGDWDFLFLTLTVKNCKGIELNDLLDKMFKAYDLLFKRKIIKDSIHGAFRALEITHNVNPDSKSFDTYHPHFHCILLVRPSYFKKSYITQAKWSELWQSVMGLDYIPLVDIQKIKGNNIKGAVAETSKYTVKDRDILNDDPDLQDSAIFFLDQALAGRRLISYRGVFAKIQKELKLDDAIDGDLVHTDNDNINKELDYVLETYKWHVGYKQYFQLDSDNKYLKDS